MGGGEMNPYFSTDLAEVTLGLALLGGVLLVAVRIGRNPLASIWGRRFTRTGLDEAASRFGWLSLTLAAFNVALAHAGPVIGFSTYFYAKLLIEMPISGFAAWWITYRLQDFRIDPPRKA